MTHLLALQAMAVAKEFELGRMLASELRLSILPGREAALMMETQGKV